jgi:hypothetical protein
MLWYHWIALGSAGICLASCFLHGIRLIRNGKPQDFSEQRGPLRESIIYSFTGAMSPLKKESAFLHLPTYTAGIIYHLGTFASIPVFFLMVSGVYPGAMLQNILVPLFILTGLCGLGILIKRLWLKKLAKLSNPDDYISNLLVTGAHLITAITLANLYFLPWYFLLYSLLLLYIPLGKLKHTVYFFAARYHLGHFYGWRGTWPPKHS